MYAPYVTLAMYFNETSAHAYIHVYGTGSPTYISLCHVVNMIFQCYVIVDPNGYRQCARPSLHVFILQELNTAECEDLACETKHRGSALPT